ncbi:MAG TPA: ATP-binding protein [bacterium]|nr:ATP-binding protein [bacterium]
MKKETSDSSRNTRTVYDPYRLNINIKSGLFAVAILMIFGVVLYTQYVVEKLRGDSRHLVRIYTHLIAHIGEGDPNGEYSFMLDEIIKRIDFPIINTDPTGEPLSWRNIPGVSGDTMTAATREKLTSVMKEMDVLNTPLPILYEQNVLGYIHYDTDTRLIRQLAWLPYIEIGLVGAFILIGYIGFSNIKRSEQRSIWVGMAKETAHQLGTPLSSMLGWIELLREQSEKRESTMKILQEMEVDLRRLDRVVARFSQIGSASDLRRQPVVSILQETAGYFRRRLPQTKQIVIEENYDGDPAIFINAQLLGWVIENLVKNAVDAIEKPQGVIKLSLSKSGDSVYIDVADDGRGIDPDNFKNVFRPGFSTKKRGWGLGLSLAKRIVEDYHRGKIFVKESRPGLGTTMRIQLNAD